jgi:hypothetical protein
MVTEIDGLSLRLDADFSDLDRAFSKLDGNMADLGRSVDASLGGAFDAAGQRMTGALERFARQGSLSFDGLRTAGLRAAADILTSFLDMGLRDIGLGGVPSGGGSAISGLLSGLFGRAAGGPVSAGVPYMVGERGPELFVPRSPGRVARGGQGGVGTTVNVNVYGAEDSGRLRQSAGQVAAAVAMTLKRAQRNL